MMIGEDAEKISHGPLARMTGTNRDEYIAYHGFYYCIVAPISIHVFERDFRSGTIFR